jgi:tetratricopeptide (TPR) repeat protein
MRRAGGVLALGLAALSGCGAHRTTERVFDGHSVVGPYIEPEAYAAFADGVYREAHGDAAGALRSYRRAQASDSDSPAIAVRIAVLTCATDLEAALSELDTSGIGRSYAPAWVERARCLRHHGRPDEALAAVQRAVMLDPDEPEANLLGAQLLGERQSTRAAGAWLFAWLLVDRDAAGRRESIQAEASKLGDTELAALARSSESSAEDASLPDPDASAPTPLERARRASASEPALALAEARRVLGANPHDADALVIALFAAHRLGDERALTELLREASPSSPPSAELAPLVLELLRHRAGDDAASAWEQAYRAPPPRP